MKKYKLVLGTTGIEITPLPLLSNPTEIITKHEIVSVSPVYNAKPVVNDDNEWIYPFDKMTIINVELSNQSRLELELQLCTNQATWNLGTLAALNQAIADINAWL